MFRSDPEEVSKAEFVAYVKRAVQPGTQESKDLYYFLLEAFQVRTFKERFSPTITICLIQAGDVNRTGEIDPLAFDKMIEAATSTARMHGLSPQFSDAWVSCSTE